MDEVQGVYLQATTTEGFDVPPGSVPLPRLWVGERIGVGVAVVVGVVLFFWSRFLVAFWTGGKVTLRIQWLGCLV